MVMMKKFLFILVALIATFQLSAQTTVKVYKGNSRHTEMLSAT